MLSCFFLRYSPTNCHPTPQCHPERSEGSQASLIAILPPSVILNEVKDLKPP